MEFILPFPPPLSALYNNVARVGRVPSKRYRAWKLEAAICANQQPVLASSNPFKPIFTSPVEVTYTFGSPSAHRRDLGNLEKGISDFLKDYGVWADDSLIHKLTMDWGEGNGVFITIKPYTVLQVGSG